MLFSASARRAPLPLVVIASVLLVACSGTETRKQRYLEKAQALVAEENFENAQLELRNALQIDPHFAQAQMLLGEVSEKLGDPRRALQMYESALDEDAGNLEARAAVARLYAFGGLPEKALEIVEPGLATAPDDVRLLLARGAARARLRDYPGAIADVERARSRAPDDPDGVSLLASLLISTNRPDEARVLVENAAIKLPQNVDLRLVLASIYQRMDRPADTERLLRELIALQPDKLVHRLNLSRFLVAGKRPADAEKVLREAIAHAPEAMEPKIGLVNLLAARSFEAADQEFKRLVAASPDDAELRIAQGDFYAARGRNEEATSAYHEALGLDGDDPQGLEARNRLAALALSSRQVDEASRLIREVLEKNPQDGAALAMRADIALSQGDAASAITDLRTVLRDQPDSAPVQRALARAYLQSNDVALAEQTLVTAAQAKPDDPDLRIELARVYLSGGQGDKAIKTLEDAVAEKPENMTAQQMLFVLYANRNEVAKARATAAAAKAARPDLAMGDYLMGIMARSENRNADALASFEAALKLQPNAREPLTGLVELLISQKRTDEAVARLRAIAKDQPANVDARNLLGEVLTSLKRYPEAVAAFDEAIALAPVWWVPYRGKALALSGAGDADGAEWALVAGLKATSGAVLLATDLASLQELRGQPDKAIATYEQLLTQNPTNDLLASNLALLLATYRSDAPSLERARELTERFKDSTVPEFLNARGWVQYKLGQYLEAVATLRGAVEQRPNTPMFRYHLAMAQYKAGQADDARENLETVLAPGARFPGSDSARETLEQLKRS